MSKKRDVKLTNMQVPRDPKMAKYDAMKNAKPIDMQEYQDLGKVEHHDSVESVAEKMIAKEEIKRGQKIDQKAQKSNLNLGGIKDDRPSRKFFKIGVGNGEG